MRYARGGGGLGVGCSIVAILSGGTGLVRADDGIVIGRDASGRLKAHVHEPSFEVPFSSFSQAPGWAFGILGIESIVIDEPDEDLFVPDSSADVEVVLVSADAGCAVWGPTAPLMAGESLHVGSPFFDYHPLWQIEDGPSGASFTLRFYAHDRAAVYTDSEEFEVVLTAAFCASDYDLNTFVNGDDFDAFVLDFELGDPRADVDLNTFVNGDDFDYFVDHFYLGC